MASTAAKIDQEGLIRWIGRNTIDSINFVGNLSLFACNMFGWIIWRAQRWSVLLTCMYQIGVKSIPVVVVTGTFIGMVLAVQSYDQLRMMHLETTIGSVVNVTLLRELGPVLAATMLAGRVGSSIAAELGTMRVTEQIEALRVLGANPIHYLVVPRFLSCFMLIPLLTVLADVAGIFGGWFFSTQVLGINGQHYWFHTDNYVSLYDLMNGLFKSFFFGAAIAIVACHRGFHCDAGAEGVGKAATEAFVYSFVLILMLDFFLGLLFTALEQTIRTMQYTQNTTAFHLLADFRFFG